MRHSSTLEDRIILNSICSNENENKYYFLLFILLIQMFGKTQLFFKVIFSVLNVEDKNSVINYGIFDGINNLPSYT
jgi:hypothetical protein